MRAITISNLTKVYKNGVRALNNVSLEVEQGDFFALLGANGAGKTTLIGILTSIVNKTAGKVRVFNYDLDTHETEAKKTIGVVPQEFNFNMFERVLDIITTQAGYFGIERRAVLPYAQELLTRLGLWEKRNSPARTLSGGMKRRLMIARALIHQPKLLILDEPTAGVDVELRYEMWEYLRSLNKNGVTILLTTHYLEEVEQMCRHAAIIKKGEIVINDRVKHLMQQVEKEIYTVAVKELKPLNMINDFKITTIDDHTLEVEVNRTQTLNAFIAQLSQLGIIVTDIRPQGFRLEKIFLNLLKSDRKA
ncbi:MAG: ABC transporter [Omnitrophica WOR_2 bacterium GWA2_47_8]|nr:MAG: ABC transporter [Omnitrophica WOR_2 bacterium GWA2_47_8]